MPAAVARKPAVQPKWWHAGGNKLEVHEIVLEGTNPCVKLKSKKVTITITPDMRNKNHWKLKWSILHVGRASSIDGEVTLSDHEMQNAFLRASTQGKEISNSGYYCRLEDWLNIPNPGTGEDGDANVSIKVGEGNDHISWAVARLMRPRQA